MNLKLKTYKIKDILSTVNGKYAVNWDYVWSIPEFAILETIEQSPKWYGEGNVKNHTELVVNEMFNIVNNIEIFNDESREILLMAALCHDLGKATKTFLGKDNIWHAYGHELDSERITRKLFWDEDFDIRESICCLVRYHMYIRNLLDSKKNLYQNIIELAFELQSRNCTLNELFTLMKCDSNGSIPEDKTINEYDIKKIKSLEMLAETMDILYHIDFHDINYLPYHGEELKRKGMKHLHVAFLIGLPGSGKNTYCDEKFNNNDDYVILSRDDIRIEMGLCKNNEKIVGTPKQEEEVTKRFNEKLEIAINLGKNIVINNINLKRKHRESIKQHITNLCKGKYEPCFTAHWIETSMENILNRRKGQISEEVFNNMIMYIDYPTYEDFYMIYNSRN